MRTIIRTLLALTLATAWVLSAAAQSANRTGTGITPIGGTKPATSVVTSESDAVRNCRLHCASLPTGTPRMMMSGAERAARADACSRKMIPR